MKKNSLRLTMALLLVALSLVGIDYTGNYVKGKRFIKEYLTPGKEAEAQGNVSGVKELKDPYTASGFDISSNPSHVIIEKMVPASSSFRIELGKVVLSGVAGSLSVNTVLSINGMEGSTLPALGAGMVNVTGEHSHFRMLPHGTKFNNNIEVILPYDRSLLPVGYTEADIHTYYYDEDYQSWIPIERDSVDSNNEVVVSKVNHFTDFINAIIKLPEMPESNAYAPTTISGIQAGNPMESLNLIQAPVANNNGTVNLSYPIEIPAGRQGMQPNLTVTYNSGGGSGWLGLGWDLNIPMVTIDTRWGVPHYDLDKESEIYLVNGEQLTTKTVDSIYNPLPHRAEWLPRQNGSVRFYPRVEGLFNRIIRHGSTPKNYWWEVIDKTGVRYFYGKKLGENSFDPNAVLRDYFGNICKWGLTEIRDLNDNFVYYTYHSVMMIEESSGWLYPDKITYTGNGTTQGKYSIIFKSKSKTDFRSNARLGVKELNDKILSDIEIQYDAVTFKQYKFCYDSGAFGKTLLKSISEPLPGCMGSDSGACGCESLDSTLVTHLFHYYEKPSELFGNEISISTGNDHNASALVSPRDRSNVTSLGGSSTSGWSIGGALTAGLGVSMNKNRTAGGNYTRSKSETKGILSMIDIDGDGLPDKVFRNNISNRLYYRKQICTNGNYSFSAPIPLSGLGDESFLQEKSVSHDLGAEAHFKIARQNFTASYNWNSTKSTTSIYMVDVNSDGLPDIVQNGKTYFNYLVGGIPHFRRNNPNVENFGSCVDPNGGGSSGISGGEVVIRDLFRDGRMVITQYPYKDEIKYDTSYFEGPREFGPTHDVVKMWIAPFSGQVRIDADVCLTSDLMETRISTGAVDGVKFYVQHKGSLLSSGYLDPDDPCRSQSFENIYVSKGDKFYFRIESLEMRYFDKVIFSPTITYNHVYYEDRTISPSGDETDSDGKKIYSFNSSEDFLINVLRKYDMPFDGRVKITNQSSVEGELSSPVQFVRHHNGSSRIWTYDRRNNILQFPQDEEFDVSSGDAIWFEAAAKTNVKWQSVRWLPEISYTAVYGGDIEAEDETEGPNINFKCIPYCSDYPKPVLPTRTYYSSMPERGSRFVFNLSGATGAGSYVFSIKDDNGIVLLKEIELNRDTTTINLDGEISLERNHKYYFDLYTHDESISSNITRAYCWFSGVNQELGLHTNHNEDVGIFGNLYRNWGQFTYLKEEDGSELINESLLRISDEAMRAYENLEQEEEGFDPGNIEFYDPLTDHFLTMDPDYHYNQWVGYGNMGYISGDTISNTYPHVSGVVEEPDFSFFSLSSDSDGYSVYKVSETRSNSYMGGYNNDYGNLGGCSNNGHTRIYSDFTDMNGDGYPDVVSELEVQYSQPQGGLSGRTAGHRIPDTNLDYDEKGFERVEFNSISGSFGGSFSKIKINNVSAGKTTLKIVELLSGASVGGTANTSNDESPYMWLDINGDGLPDRVYDNGVVHLNLGYRYNILERRNTSGSFKEGHSSSFSGSAGGAIPTDFNWGQTSFSGGLSVGTSNNHINTIYMDVNGDGLPDKLTYGGGEITVRYSIGDSYSTPEVLISGNDVHIFRNSSVNGSINVAVSIGFSLFGVKFIGNPKFGKNWGVSKTTHQFIDMDGDGYPDYVTSNDINEIKVRYNQIGKSNLLKSVTNIANGKFTVDYELSQSTQKCPYRSWTMSGLQVFDGHIGDGVDYQYYSFEYDDARYDRYERENMGFAEVRTKQRSSPALASTSNIYRMVTEKYHTGEYMRKGLKYYELLSSFSTNASLIKKYVEKEYKYALHNIKTGALISEDDFCGSCGYPALREENVNYYEGLSAAGIKTNKLYEYGPYGNVIKYVNKGDISDPGDDLITEISYHPDTYNKNITGIASEIKVKDNTGNLLRDRTTVINNKAELLALTIYNRNITSVYSYTYDSYGNMASVSFPVNHMGEGKKIYYYYDGEVGTYTVRTTTMYSRLFTYSSFATYDYRWGKPLTTTDINNNIMDYEYDWRGRMIKVKAPGEQEDFTIRFHYWFDRGINYLPGSTNYIKPWSVTYNNHNLNINDRSVLTTVVFCDGSGKIIQTKKESEVNGSLFNCVSGRNDYDVYGRIVSSYYPVTERILSGSTDYNQRPDPRFNTGMDIIVPTSYTYDILDRQQTIRLPDNSMTGIGYSFATDYNGIKRFRTSVTDANGIRSHTYTDARGLQTMTYSILENTDIKTLFEYNVIGELVSTTDPDGLQTGYQYDMLGRNTMRKHPDAGIDTYEYDAYGNLISHKTQKLSNAGSEIKYIYFYDLLKEVQYPENPENNVVYTYGNYAATANNQAGRIQRIDDGTGRREYSYDKFGNVTEDTRTIVLPSESAARTFKTIFTYDSWGKLLTMEYPDKELLSYTYERGGQLKTLTGVKGNENFVYISSIKYDKFGKRTEIRYGNGTRSAYTYDYLQRLNKMKTYTPGNILMQDIIYSYDAVSNITGISNTAATLSNGLGGTYTNTYEYDDLYRLKRSNSTAYHSTGRKESSFNMEYSNNGRITKKATSNTQWTNGSDLGASSSGTRTYEYDGGKNTLRRVVPSFPSRYQLNYTWDENGNFDTEIATGMMISFKRLLWDESNQLILTTNTDYAGYYGYDFSGERTFKYTGACSRTYINGVLNETYIISGLVLYPDPYLVINRNGYTKHIYAGGERIASKTGGGGISGLNSHLLTQTEITAKKSSQNAMFTRIRSGLSSFSIEANIFRYFSNFINFVSMETDIYYYHSDHLGSSSWITSTNGSAIQHMQYHPFGETNIDQRTGDWNARYTFSGKEKDEETGYHYFGARYYDSGLGIWLSVDPMASKYPSTSPYAYCRNNPIMLVDPNGMEIDEWDVDKDGNVKYNKDAPKSNVHTLHALDKNGNRNGNSIELKDRSILDQLSNVKGTKVKKDAEGTIYESGNVRNAIGGRENLDDMLNVFKFAADNTNVEWNFEYAKENGESKYSVGTWGIYNQVGYFMENGQITGIHSHPSTFTDISSEIKSMSVDRQSSKNRNYIQYVYMRNSNRLYNVEKGNSSFIRNIKTSKDFINVGR